MKSLGTDLTFNYPRYHPVQSLDVEKFEKLSNSKFFPEISKCIEIQEQKIKDSNDFASYLQDVVETSENSWKKRSLSIAIIHIFYHPTFITSTIIPCIFKCLRDDHPYLRSMSLSTLLSIFFFQKKKLYVDQHISFKDKEYCDRLYEGYSADNMHILSVNVFENKLVNYIPLEEEFWSRIIDFFSLEQSNSAEQIHENFNHSIFQFFKSIIQCGNIQVIEILQKLFCGLINSDEKPRHRVAAEMFAAFIRGSRKLNDAQLAHVMDWIMQQFLLVIPRITNSSLNFWECAFDSIFVF